MHAPKQPRSLRSLVIDLIETTDLADPRDIAAAVLAKATAAQREVFLREALTTEVRLILGHQHADALRIVSKALLRDLWRAARDIHNPTGTTETE